MRGRVSESENDDNFWWSSYVVTNVEIAGDVTKLRSALAGFP